MHIPVGGKCTGRETSGWESTAGDMQFENGGGGQRGVDGAAGSPWLRGTQGKDAVQIALQRPEDATEVAVAGAVCFGFNS